MRTGALLVLLLGVRLPAQAGPEGWAFTGMLGSQFRTERGSLIDGATIDLGLLSPMHGMMRWGADAALVQVLARATIGTERVSSVESSLEGSAMAMTELLQIGAWRLEGAAGAIASVSVGCGRFLQQPVDTIAGAGECVNAFAQRGDTRLGARVRLLGEWTSPRASVFAAVMASANTIASGNHVAPGLLAGVRTPLR
jgi:hypothetical protein